MKKTKIIVMVMALALLVGALIGIAATATESTTPEIVAKNIRYGEDLKFRIAVDGDALGADKTVTVNFYEADPATDASPVDTATAVYTDTSDKSKYNLDVDHAYIAVSNYGISAIAYGQTFYITAECDGVVSEVLEYSAVEYFLERLYADADSITDIQKKHYENTIAYGSTAQLVTGDTKTNVADYVYVMAQDGKVNGSAGAVAVKGDALTFTYTGAEDVSGLAYWLDPNGAVVTSKATVSGLYTPKFADVTFNNETVGGKISIASSTNKDTFYYENRTEENDSDKVVVLNNTSYNDIRFVTTRSAEANANCFVFETDMNLSGGLDKTQVQFWLGVSDKLICANFDVWNDNGTIKMIDYHSEGTKSNRDDGAKATVIGTAGEWFNFRLEYYYEGSRENVRLKYYINNELVLCTNNYFWSNVIEVTDDGIEDTYYAPLTTVDRAMRVTTSSSCTTGVFKFDNYSFYNAKRVCADDPLTYVTQD